MNSKNLMEKGFSECLPLKSLTHSNLPKDQGIVIAIMDLQLAGKPESDILYIGRTKKPAKRILGGYIAGYGGKNTKKINQMLFDEGYIDRVAISWVSAGKPRVMQEELIAKYKEDHGEIPVWNSKKKTVKPKKSPPKSKDVQASKTKPTPPKAAAKRGPKPKTAAPKKPASIEIPAKAEVPKKEEAGTGEMSPKP